MLIRQITISYTLKFPNYRNVHEKIDIFLSYLIHIKENVQKINLYNLYI